MKNIKLESYSIPFLLVALLAMLLVPMPTFLLDFLFTFNIAFSMVIILVAISSRKSVDFSVFPTILLLATLLRLALNVASTRVVLLNGYNGEAAAGQVIEAFGTVLIGGNYAVGFAIFAILIIINFIVITKGATRVSEVSARFTLDALPGKQMAVDSDLNSGIISKDEAKQKRQDLETESEFYGAMDGASKFVRGDAVAGILILFVNLFAGVLIGTMQYDLSITDAVRNYSLLTIGDGLVAQVPALLLSIAAAIMVTRVSKDEQLSENFIEQITDEPKVIYITASIILLLGLMPGMPKLIFIGSSSLLFSYAYFIKNKKRAKNIVNKKDLTTDTNQETKDVKNFSWDDIDDMDVITLELGFNVISAISKNHQKFIDNITVLRKKISNYIGFLIPAIKIKDNLNLPYNNYKIYINGVVVFSEDINKNMDINKIIFKNLSNIIILYAYEIFGYKEAEELLLKYKKNNSNNIQNKIMDQVSISVITKIFQDLLFERIFIKDTRSIFQIIFSGYYNDNKSYDVLFENVRIALSKYILQCIYNFTNSEHKKIYAIILDKQIIQKANYLKDDYNKFKGTINYIKKQINTFLITNEQKMPVILLVPNDIRYILAKKLSSFNELIYIMSYKEIPNEIDVEVVLKLCDNMEELA